ncbi:GrpB family protein [Priestia koreensis]|uniref:GrpB family protein n=1 Tax=Priestia koreensis TaxID=284581 RepID=UPI00345B2976
MMEITVTSYNQGWPLLFQSEQEQLDQLLKDVHPTIEHIGSTSIPGLLAKPIIDMMIGLKRPEEMELATEALVQAGYIYVESFNAIIPERRFFIALKDGVFREDYPNIITKDPDIHIPSHTHRFAHIHLTLMDSPFWTDHLAFRNYLRTNEEARHDYAALKEELSAKQWKNGNEYAKAKGAFIGDIIQKAKSAESMTPHVS